MSAFSNGTEFDVFCAQNCAGCVEDGLVGDGPENAQCRYIDTVFLNPELSAPSVWLPHGGMGRYTCTARRTA